MTRKKVNFLSPREIEYGSQKAQGLIHHIGDKCLSTAEYDIEYNVEYSNLWNPMISKIEFKFSFREIPQFIMSEFEQAVDEFLQKKMKNFRPTVTLFDVDSSSLLLIIENFEKTQSQDLFNLTLRGGE